MALWKLIIKTLTWVQQLICHLTQSRHSFLFWCVNDHYSASQKAEHAAELPEQVHRFPKQVRGQYSARDRSTDRENNAMNNIVPENPSNVQVLIINMMPFSVLVSHADYEHAIRGS